MGCPISVRWDLGNFRVRKAASKCVSKYPSYRMYKIIYILMLLTSTIHKVLHIDEYLVTNLNAYMYLYITNKHGG